MADEPVAMLGGKTPLQYANTPSIDELAGMGKTGMLNTVPEGFEPGSEIANLSVLGYNVADVFEGRGSLEAASMGIDILQGEMAMRCNLICIENGKIKNHSAGHISNPESWELIHFLNEKLLNERISFYPGVSYRHLLKVVGGNKQLICTPPHNAMGTPFDEILVKAETKDAVETANLLNNLILRSQQLLEDHPVNLRRKLAGNDPANSIWPWSPGYKPNMKSLAELFPVTSGAVISAVDLIKGIGVYAGLKPIDVEGATGLYNTNYEAKAQAAIQALRENDFVYLHIEASDEAGHEGDVLLKVKTIEYLDNRIVRPILEELRTWQEPVTVALLPDHPTPCHLKTHTSAPVPFVIYKTMEKGDDVCTYDEFSCRKGYYGSLKGDEFMKAMFEQ